MLPVKKLYIDSKAKTVDSKSTTDFAVDLVESLTFPEGAKFQVCDVMIPHTWYLINDNNCNLYFLESDGTDTNNFQIKLDTGNYDGPSLAGEIAKKIKERAIYYGVNVTFDVSTSKLIVGASPKVPIVPSYTYVFNILADDELTHVSGESLNTLNKF